MDQSEKENQTSYFSVVFLSLSGVICLISLAALTPNLYILITGSKTELDIFLCQDKENEDFGMEACRQTRLHRSGTFHVLTLSPHNSTSGFKYLSTAVVFAYGDLRTQQNMHEHKPKSV